MDLNIIVFFYVFLVFILTSIQDFKKEKHTTFSIIFQFYLSFQFHFSKLSYLKQTT